MSEIGILTAFLGGLLSFLSPCVLPLAPPYLAFIAGTTLDQFADGAEPDAAAARRIRIASLFFVAGLGTVFVALGATASAVGQLIASYRYEFGIIAGFTIFVLGQHFIGFRRAPQTAALVVALFAVATLISGGSLAEALDRQWPALLALAALATALRLSGHYHLPFLMREARFDAGGAAGTYGGAYVIGLAFAFGWTPCIGPALGLILALAAQQDTLGQGTALLAVYAAGLGLPFVLAAWFVRPFMRWMKGFRRHLGTVERAMGGMLVVVGMMMATGTFETLAFWLLETFPALGTLG